MRDITNPPLPDTPEMAAKRAEVRRKLRRKGNGYTNEDGCYVYTDSHYTCLASKALRRELPFKVTQRRFHYEGTYPGMCYDFQQGDPNAENPYLLGPDGLRRVGFEGRRVIT